MSESSHLVDAGTAFERLCCIMARLRSADGCPWDAKQTPESLKDYIIEECYEVLEAIDLQDPRLICEELGDLLLQVVFQTQIFAELGNFSHADVANGIADKLIRRHPHVFDDQPTGDEQALHQQWEAIKLAEKQDRGRTPKQSLDDIPQALPALQRAQKLSSKAARKGFDWPNIEGPRSKIDEEWHELNQAMETGQRSEIEHEIGDLLFAVTNLSRHLEISAEEALRKASRRFSQRFNHLEGQVARLSESLDALSLEQKLQLWSRAKNATKA